MNSSYTTLPLLDTSMKDDPFANKAFDIHYDDSSSGYESTDISDLESVSSWGSRDSLDSKSYDRSGDDEEIMNFSSTHMLSEHLKLILALPEMRDVTFIVGPNEVPVHGVRAIMGTRSRVMYHLILKHMSMEAADKERKSKKNKKVQSDQSVGIGRSLSQRLVIPVKKYDSEVFRLLVQFIHCGSVDITEETVADSSSGYESTDISDLESVSSWGSRDSLDSKSYDRSGDDEEVMNFSSTHMLSEHLKLILALPEMRDVTFIVGPNEVPVHGVRAIMGTRSRVMYHLILKHMSMEAADKERKSKKNKKVQSDQSVGIGRSLSQRLVIPVKKYDSEVFRLLVQFIHCGSVDITEETVAGLFCAASHFELQDLSKACLDFVERCIRVGRAEKLLFSTRCYSQHKATKILFDKIYSVLDRRYNSRLYVTPV